MPFMSQRWYVDLEKKEWLKSNRWKNKNRFLVLVWMQLIFLQQQHKIVLSDLESSLDLKAVDKSQHEHSLFDFSPV